jgi:alternate signal-mediated exported protein
MTTNTKKKKSAREKRVIVASLIVAAVMIGGSTFAWFTSKDEVTNRLSANAKYDVSIAEDFQPPEDWVPGQTINKDVSAVNTGNVDAFVRMWLEGEMNLIKKASDTDSTAIPADADITAGLGYTAVDPGDDLFALGFKYQKDGNYYKILSTDKIKNPDDKDDAQTVDANNQPAIFSEVQSVQAGGYLVAAPTGAKWHYTLEQETQIKTSDNKTASYAVGTVVGTTGATGVEAVVAEGSQNIDSDSFTPETPGLYIFRRNIDISSTANTADDYEYSGYLFDGTNYWALRNDATNNRSEYVLPDGAVTVATNTEPEKEPLTYTVDRDKIKLYTAKETVVENSGLTWTYNATYGADDTATPPIAGAPAYIATYGTGDETLKIVVNLANIGADSEQWTELGATNKATFYYNNDVEAGDTTTKLVESVVLDKDTKKEAFIAFDFDLNVFLESIQVTKSEAGVEGYDSVSAWTFADRTGATGSDNGPRANTQEIEKIKWS